MHPAVSRCPLYLFVACNCIVNRVLQHPDLDGQQEAEQNDQGRDTLLCSGSVGRLLTTLHVCRIFRLDAAFRPASAAQAPVPASPVPDGVATNEEAACDILRMLSGFYLILSTHALTASFPC